MGLMNLPDLRSHYFYRLPFPHIVGDYVWPGVVISSQRLLDIKELDFDEEDIVIASYPKSGTTWLSEMVSALVFDGDLDAIKQMPLEDRVPWLDLERSYWWVRLFDRFRWLFERVGPSTVHEEPPVAPKPRRRVFFTHLPMEFLPRAVLEGKCRLLCVARNPKDVAVSFYHFHQMARFLGLQRTLPWDDFFALYATGSLYCGSWFEHVLGYWRPCQQNPRALFLKYEEMKRRPSEQIHRLASFLHLSSPLTDAKAQQVLAHCSFDSMKSNTMANRDIWLFDQSKSKFMRKGEVGDWINYFTLAQSRAFNQLYQKKMDGTGLHFDFEEEVEGVEGV